MLVTLGDGRVVECAAGIRKVAPGPVPKTLASEVVRPAASHGPAHHRDGGMRDPGEVVTGRCGPRPARNGESAFGPIPAMLRAGGD